MHPRQVIRCLAVLFAVLVFVPALHAADLYSAQVPVTSQSDVERAGALKTALAQVMVGLTGGDNAVLARPEVSKAIADAVKYVQQYSYASDVVTDNGQPKVQLSLIAQFDRNAVDKLLADLGLAHGGSGQAQAVQAAADIKPQTYRVWISGLNSALDYVNAVSALSRNSLVRSVLAEQARGDGVEMQIEVTGPLQRLLDSLPGSGLRVINAKPPLEGVDALLGIQP